MIGTTRLLVGLSLALACGVATSANAQLAAHKDLTLPIAVEMAQTAVQTCNAQGNRVSVHVVGRTGEVLVALHLNLMIPAQGALPIVVDGDTIGAIGVSGSPGGDKDEACAKAGIDKVADKLK